MKKIKNSLMLSVVMVLLFSTMSSAAPNIAKSASSFTQAWSLTSTFGTTKLVYGFNTYTINEDTAWVYDTKREHLASISNGNGNHYGWWYPPNGVSKKEVRHKSTVGGYVYYYAEVR